MIQYNTNPTDDRPRRDLMRVTTPHKKCHIRRQHQLNLFTLANEPAGRPPNPISTDTICRRLKLPIPSWAPILTDCHRWTRMPWVQQRQNRCQQHTFSEESPWRIAEQSWRMLLHFHLLINYSGASVVHSVRLPTYRVFPSLPRTHKGQITLKQNSSSLLSLSMNRFIMLNDCDVYFVVQYNTQSIVDYSSHWDTDDRYWWIMVSSNIITCRHLLVPLLNFFSFVFVTVIGTFVLLPFVKDFNLILFLFIVAIRLAGGKTENHGRPELSVNNGEWGSICQYHSPEAEVFCRMLGL